MGVNDSFDLNDYIVIQNPHVDASNNYNVIREVVIAGNNDCPAHWDRRMTLALLAEYKESHPLMVKKYRSVKALFIHICDKLNDNFKLNLSWTQVNNKFKSLEATYKKVADNNGKTGRRCKDFEYEREMEDIFGKRRNVNPELLLSADTEVLPMPPLKATREDLPRSAELNNSGEDENFERDPDDPPSQMNDAPRRRRRKTRFDVLEKSRQDRKAHMELKRKLLNEKVATGKRIAAAIEMKNELVEKKVRLLEILIDKLGRNEH